MILAAAQTASVAGDIAHNVAHHASFARQAAAQGVQLVVFPELSLTGYELDLARTHTLRPDSRELEPLREVANQTGITIVAGAPLANATGQLHIGALILQPHAPVETYTKVHVHHTELHVFTPGAGGPLLKFPDATVALGICADASHPEHAANAAAAGATVYATGALTIEKEYSLKCERMSRYARDHHMVTLFANYSGVSGGFISAGKSAIWSTTGQVLAASADRGEELVIARIH
ncbi:MAG: carbon-nitrogen hydrolase family protein [Acidobacteria bacterium]|nr:carbon-nitrogen hydrolase family protein [Acidobacteriota bacterium]